MTPQQQHTAGRVQSALETFRQALDKVHQRRRWLNYEADLWPDQCQVALLEVRAVQPAARQLAVALRDWPLPPALVVILPTRLFEIERELVDEAALHLVAVKAVCRSVRVEDLRLRKGAREAIHALLESGQAVLDDLLPLGMVEKQVQRVHVWIVEADPAE
jgi:hypothetical protein